MKIKQVHLFIMNNERTLIVWDGIVKCGRSPILIALAVARRGWTNCTVEVANYPLRQFYKIDRAGEVHFAGTN